MANGPAGNARRYFLLVVFVALMVATSKAASGQVAPLAPRWLAGTPTPPVVRIAAADVLRWLRATGAIAALGKALQIEGDDTAREHLRESIRVLGHTDSTR